jgi:acid phosphatase (class A)
MPVRNFDRTGLIVLAFACALHMPYVFAANPPVAILDVIAKPDQDKVYLLSSQFDSTRFLAPPPDAEATQREIEAMLVLQKNRTPQQVLQTVSDLRQSVLMFADVMGPQFTRANLPATVKLFDKLYKTQRPINRQGKEKWKRVRPPLADDRLTPSTLYKSHSYPSGHATYAYLAGIVLADLIPNKREQIYDRAYAFGENRVIGGVHYPSDVEAGRQLASMIAVLIQRNPDFQRDLAASRAELKALYKQ